MIGQDSPSALQRLAGYEISRSGDQLQARPPAPQPGQVQVARQLPDGWDGNCAGQSRGRDSRHAQYTVWLLSMKPNLPGGCTIADMAEDYARPIAGEFAGKADVVVGDSGAGIIGFDLAARHPDAFGHIVIAVPGPMTEAANAANLEFARLLSAGRKADAAAVLVTLQRPGIRSRWVIRLLAWVVARVGLAAAYEPRDILVSAEALNAFDGREILPSIPVPVLVVCGEKDRWASKEVYEQTAGLIPECTLKMYEGKDHLGVMFDKRLPRDVLDFVRHPRPAQN